VNKAADPSPIIFKVNTIWPGQHGVNHFVKAGEASPCRSLEEVPESLRSYIGSPEVTLPPPTDNYDWAPDPFAKDPPGIREMLSRVSAQMVSEASAHNAVLTKHARQERQTLDAQRVARLAEFDRQSDNYFLDR
jgi:hypothetical protein